MLTVKVASHQSAGSEKGPLFDRNGPPAINLGDKIGFLSVHLGDGREW